MGPTLSLWPRWSSEYVEQASQIGVVLEEDDPVKLKYLIVVMIGSRSSRMST